MLINILFEISFVINIFLNFFAEPVSESEEDHLKNG